MRVAVTLCVALCLLVVAASATDSLRARRTQSYPRFVQLFAHATGTLCAGMHCPYDNAICCPGKGGRAPTCCPPGYKCSYPNSGPTTCDVISNKAGGGNSITTIRPTLVLNDGAAGQAQAQAQAQAQQASPSASAGQSASAGSGSSTAPKFRQNIIIVKNINVLTKLQQVKPHGHGSSSTAPVNSTEASQPPPSRFGQTFAAGEEGATEEAAEHEEAAEAAEAAAEEAEEATF